MGRKAQHAKASTAHKPKAPRGRRSSKTGPPAAKSDPGEAGLLTRRELSLRLDRHMQTITKWEAEGLPIAIRGRRGRPSRYDEGKVRAWLEAREEAAKQPAGAMDLVQERARKERAQAELAEQAYQAKARELLPKGEVERVWSGHIQAARTVLLGMRQTYADRLFRTATLEGLAGVERLLEEIAREILRELAGEIPAGPPPGAAADGARAA